MNVAYKSMNFPVHELNRVTKSILFLLFSVALFFSSLFDVYINGVGRIYDYFALAILLSGAIFLLKNFRLKLPIWLLLVCCVWGIAVIRADNYVSAFAAIFGLITFILAYQIFSKVCKDARFEKTLLILAAIHAMFFVVQLLFFKLGGKVIDFAELAGSSIDSRIYNSQLNYFRASGLLQEPNSFSQVAFLLILCLFRFSSKPAKFMRYLLCTCMLISNSLWGIVAAIGYIGLFFLHKEFKAVLLFLTLAICFTPIWLDPVTVRRVSTLERDPSLHARFIQPSIFDSTQIKLASDNQLKDAHSHSSLKFDKYLYLFIGHGFSSSKYASLYGVNAWSYLLYSLGILGLMLIIALGYFYDKHPFKANLICMSVFCITYPLFTCAYFWFCLVMVILIPTAYSQSDTIFPFSLR